MINLTIDELKLLSETMGKGKFSDLKHILHLKLLSELKDKLDDEEHIENNCVEAFFHYINYNDEYKFKARSMIGRKMRRKDTGASSEQEFTNCNYIDLGIRKCDVLNTDFLKGLKASMKIADRRQAHINKIKDNVK